MNRDAQALHFVCTDCGRRAVGPQECPCGAGPLIDLAKPEFREMAVEADDRRAERHGQRVLWAGVAAGILGGGFLLLTMYEVIQAIPLPVPFAMPIKVLALMIGLTLGATKGIGSMWLEKRRFPELAAHRETVQLPSKIRAPRRATLIGIGAFVGLGIAINIAVPIVQKHLRKEERKHLSDVEKKFEKLHNCVSENRPMVSTDSGSSKDEDWTEECKGELTGLYESLDGRSADMALKANLEGEFDCQSKCKPRALKRHYRDLFNAAKDMGMDLRLDDYQPRSKRRSAFGDYDSSPYGRLPTPPPFELPPPPPVEPDLALPPPPVDPIETVDASQ